MSPKRIDKEERKKQIALGALDLFAEKGLEGTSISEVAQQAGIGKGTVYEYFSSKEDLILTAFMAWLEQMMDSGLEEALLQTENPEERFRTLVLGMIEPVMSDDRVIKITLLLFQLMIKDETLWHNKQVYQILQGFRKVLTDMLLEGVAQGAFKPEIARDVLQAGHISFCDLSPSREKIENTMDMAVRAGTIENRCDLGTFISSDFA